MDATYEIVGTLPEEQLIVVEYTPPVERSYLKAIRVRLRCALDADTTEQDLTDCAEAGLESAIGRWEEHMDQIQRRPAVDYDAMVANVGRRTVTLAADLAAKSRRARIAERSVAPTPEARSAGTEANDALDV